MGRIEILSTIVLTLPFLTSGGDRLLQLHLPSTEAVLSAIVSGARNF